MKSPIQAPKNNVKRFSHVNSRIDSGISPNKAQHIPSRTQQQPRGAPSSRSPPAKSPKKSPTHQRNKSQPKVPAHKGPYNGNTFGQYEFTDQDEGWILFNPNSTSNNKSSFSGNRPVEEADIDAEKSTERFNKSPQIGMNNRRKSVEEVHNMEKACLSMAMALQNVTFKRMNSVFQSIKNVLYTPVPMVQEEYENMYYEDHEASFGRNPTRNGFNEKVRRSEERVVLEENQVLQGLIKINNLFINVKALVDRTKLSTFNQLQFQTSPSLNTQSPQENVTNY